VTVVSDHGEEFGEHGAWFHGIQLHAESLAVPLVMWDSRGRAGPARRTEAVDLLDVPTTLLAAGGAPRPAGMRGRDLGRTALGERVLVAELDADPPFEEQVRRREQRVAVTDWPWKLIRSASGARLWYRLDRDPEERTLLDSGDAALLEEAERSLAARREPGADEALDPDQIEALRALGYLE
jgi:arylsulfatase A-like enzyme